MFTKWLHIGSKVSLQVMLLIGIALIGQGITWLTHIKIPGSLIGLGLLFLLLQLKAVKLEWFEQGANFLLAEMLLFFVPSASGIVQYGNLVRSDGWRVIVTIGISTILVMIVSGTIAELWIKQRKKAQSQL